MVFVLEQLTDDQREQMGFARTMDELKMPNGRRVKFVNQCAINEERNIFLIHVVLGTFELHIDNKLVKIALINHSSSEDEEGKFYINYEIKELVIQKDVGHSLEEIQTFLKEAFDIYGNGSSRKYYLKGRIKFSDTIEIRFADKPKSETKVSDYVKLN